MKFTDELRLRKPEAGDYVLVNDFNVNNDIIDREITDTNNNVAKKANIEGPKFMKTAEGPSIYNSETQQFEMIATTNDVSNKLIVKELK